MDAWERAGGGRRRPRAVLARRLQERNGVGRSDARARRQGGLHRHHRVEDAGAVRRSLRLHLRRRARGRRDAPRPGHRAEGHHDQRAHRRSRLAALSALGPRHPGPGPAPRHPVVVASGRRRLSAAREPGLPGVLHVLPAPDSGRLPGAVDREHHGRDRAAVRPAPEPVRHLPRSAVQRAARPVSRALRPGGGARPEVHVRSGDAARSPRRRSAEPAARRRVPRDELRRRVARSGDAQEVGPPAHSPGRTSARS